MCGARSLFAPLPHWFRTNERCERCGLRFERDEGFFLGAMVFNYTIAGVLGLTPALVLAATGALSIIAATGIALGACLVLPLIFYRTSKSLWLMTYYLAVPGELGVTPPRR